MKSLQVMKTILRNKFIPPKPLLGRWTLDNNYIKTDLANHDCCGDKLCGDPTLTKVYISKTINETKKNIN